MKNYLLHIYFLLQNVNAMTIVTYAFFDSNTVPGTVPSTQEALGKPWQLALAGGS